MQPLVLIIEDEISQAMVLQYNLEADGFAVKHAVTGDEGMLLAEEYTPAAIILDWMLPDVSGIEVCRRLKARKQTKSIPVLMLTARGEEADRVRGLNIGADDFMVKPHSIRELIARVHALMRRTSGANTEMTYADICLNTETHRVSRGDHRLKIGPTEFKLLQCFLERPHKVWTRAQLLDHVWGMDSDIEDRTVDVHVGRLRNALNIHQLPNLIRTIRGTGYSLDADD
ncbi:MAG: phosphate regulon transcriptional regulator PhoB [Robiginitomaculum sp.]|nr:phosphate regulon transcriptional regulator PhoB [Robiginitomaculum sp.]